MILLHLLCYVIYYYKLSGFRTGDCLDRGIQGYDIAFSCMWGLRIEDERAISVLLVQVGGVRMLSG
jgi:hypothetical protein